MRSNEEVIRDIERILTDYVQPSVEMHGGNVSLHEFNDGIATIFMSGACSGCAMSSLTLHAGIENMLKYYVKEVVAVKGVEDENSEVDPYYK